MKEYKEQFIKLMIDSNVLKFGDFVTKSGRNTPFFINMGEFAKGSLLCALGEYYADAIMEHFGDTIKGEGVNVLFGPAYKGIPLSVATVMALHSKYGVNLRYAANRKEIKDHGEGGALLGGPINEGDKVIIIEDVTTAGTSIKETYPIITAKSGVKVIGLVIAVDRMERGDGQCSALEQIQETYGIKTCSIVNMKEVTQELHNKPYQGQIVIDDDIKSRIDKYYEQYGA